MTTATVNEVVATQKLADDFTEVWTPTGEQVLLLTPVPSGRLTAHVCKFGDRAEISSIELAPTDMLIIIE